MTTLYLCSTLTVVCLAIMLVAEKRKDLRLRRIFKPPASLGFIGVGLAAGALESPYGIALLVGLCASFLGDVFLMWRTTRYFMLGLFAFLIGHIAYGVGFVLRGVDSGWLGGASLVAIVIGALVLRWLWPHVGKTLRGPVVAYVVVISAMVALAFATNAITASPLLLAGAILFYLSDLSVARSRFMDAGFGNVLWGLPAYYFGQLLLAFSIL